ncbi:ATP-binding cassette domain-containing protein [Corynebacterium ulceribovis]|uniref:ATP-binding cassette domain-containing protein n=1 Tax=Corynebacterium ulceribovis TaxID=487732 RepID=UPI00036459C7|nr:ATP-binding cassette domain-containing protein [Corynebacterium ulceribovis]
MNSTIPHDLIPWIVAAGTLQLILMTVAIVVLFRTPKQDLRELTQIRWLIVIVLANFAGPLAFLIVGRERRRAPLVAAKRSALALEPVDVLFPRQNRSLTTNSAIDFSAVTKRFGAHPVLDDLNLTVPPGTIFGLLGQNGAGKTTALRILMGFAQPSSGHVSIFGIPSTAVQARHDVGYLPDVPVFDPWLTPEQYLRQTAKLTGVPTEEVTPRVAAALELANLSNVNRSIGGLSRGMRQRLGIVNALVHGPRVVVLDEPTSALDPIARVEVLHLIQAIRRSTTVFFSTHSMADVGRVCDHVAFLGSGRIIASGSVDNIVQTFTDSNAIRASFHIPKNDFQQVELRHSLEALGGSDIEFQPAGDLEEAFAQALGGSK